MAITFEESWESRPQSAGDKSNLETIWIASGSDDPNAVRAAAIADTSGPGSNIYQSLVIQTISVARLGHDSCRVRTKYGTLEPPTEGLSRFTFNTAGGTEHVTQALSTVGSFTNGNTVVDLKDAIGVTRDDVKGTNIPKRVFQFSETHYISDLAVTDAYKKNLYLLTTKWNASAFRSFDAGEVQFLGVQGGQIEKELWELSFGFQATPNETDINVGGIVVPQKLGWDYLDVYYGTREDGASGLVIQSPRQVDVKRVVESGNFSDMGIGT